jgi:TonB family protein
MSDPNPRVRAAAARVAHVGFVKTVAPAIRQALEVETDADAAREQIRALAALAPAEEDAFLRRAAARFAGRLDFALLEALARTRHAAVVDLLLDPSNSFAIDRAQEAELVLLGSRLTPEAGIRYADAVLDRADADRWKAFLAAAAFRKISLPDSVLSSGIASREPEIAGRSAWALAVAHASGESLGTTVPEGIAPPASTNPDVGFALRLARRRVGDSFETDSAWIAFLEDRAHETIADSIGPYDTILSLLSVAERDAVRKRWELRNRSARPGGGGRDPGKTLKQGGDARWVPRQPAVKPEVETASLRAVTDLPRGVLQDALAISGCRPDRDGLFGASSVRYNVEGRPLQVTSLDVSVSKACDLAARNLVLLTIAPRSALPVKQRPEILLGVAGEGCMGELDEIPVAEPGAVGHSQIQRVGGDVEAPVLVKRAEPEYPAEARRAGLEGVVILEAIISESGCVREVVVSKGAGPLLDFQAMRAVFQWRYKPAQLNGRPVRVYLTVTVSFNLGRRR